MKNVTLKIGYVILGAAILSSCGSGQNSTPKAAKPCLTEDLSPIGIPAAVVKIGSETAYREEAPVRDVALDRFNIDATEVTNNQFAAFVSATNYITDAEKIQTGFGVAGGAVFTTPTPQNPSWWSFKEGANWRHPEGPESSIEARGREPVVQVSLKDAKAYADWTGRSIPNEAQWEYAANGGANTRFVWGSERAPNGVEQANTWQGSFPLKNSEADGYRLRAPVGCFAANGYGLYDMIGNVWEWTDTPYIEDAQDLRADTQYKIKGGSFLCAPNYCRRYRASALQPQEANFTTNHIGFRTVSP